MGNKLKIETGLNKNGDCVIILSPELYDKFIDECIMIVNTMVESIEEMRMGNTEIDETIKDKMIEDIMVIIALSRHSKLEDLINQN